jgi:hypothetical protein
LPSPHWPTAGAIEQLERELGVNVMTAQQAIVGCAAALWRERSHRRLGRLLRGSEVMLTRCDHVWQCRSRARLLVLALILVDCGAAGRKCRSCRLQGRDFRPRQHGAAAVDGRAGGFYDAQGLKVDSSPRAAAAVARKNCRPAASMSCASGYPQSCKRTEPAAICEPSLYEQRDPFHLLLRAGVKTAADLKGGGYVSTFGLSDSTVTPALRRLGMTRET